MMDDTTNPPSSPLRSGEALWGLPYDGGSDEAPTFSPLSGAATADAVVVGAGVAGLWVAHELQRSGRSVVVLEGRRVGSGTTGSSTAKVSALQGAVYHQLRRHDAEVARLFAEANLGGVER